MRTVEIEVFGKVQGVFFRANVLKEAQKLKLSGGVRNTSSGSVVIECSGSEVAVDSLVDFCKTGSVDAIVKSVKVRMIQQKSFPNFRIIS